MRLCVGSSTSPEGLALGKDGSLLRSLLLDGLGAAEMDSMRRSWTPVDAMDAAGWHYATYTIFEGTSEIQRLVISRAISGIHIQ